MTEPTAAKGSPPVDSAVDSGTPGPLRLASFRVTYVAILVFVLLSLTTIDQVGKLLERHFQRAVAGAVRVSPAHGPIVAQVESRVKELLLESMWVRWGDVEVDVQVFSADGRTTLFAIGEAIPPPPDMNPHRVFLDAIDVLPALPNVVVTVPPLSRLAASIVLLYGSVLVTGLFYYNRAVARREQELLSAAVAARDSTAQRARDIEEELDRVRERVRKVEPGERARADEIRRLETEREGLRRKLDELAEREADLRVSAARATELDEEHRALEDLLEEAMLDLNHKESEIQGLQDRLKRASKGAPTGGRGRAAEQLGRRLRTLYKNLEFDDRAIQDLVALRDETNRLRAEEGIKRLEGDPDTAAIRRKVGGLPPQLSIFELGFGGKGRIYYTRGNQQRYRILAIGAKNTQKTDLEYLSRL
jgi:hypothetical protein